MTFDYILKHKDNFSKLSKSTLISMVVFLFNAVLLLRKELIKKKNKDINSKVNQPSSKKAEFNKDDKKKKKKRKKKKNTKKNKGCGNKSKENLIPDHTNKTELLNCPHCNTDLSEIKGQETKSRIVEDILSTPEKTEVTEEICENKWCPTCKEMVGSKTIAALPGSDIGLRATVLITYLWVIMAVTLPNIVRFLSSFFKMKISCAGISRLMIRISKIIMPIYEEILNDVRNGAIVHADETGWKVCGVLWWLWVFGNKTSAIYWPDRSRGGPVVEKILGRIFFGTLITDAWCAYIQIVCLGKQTCTHHLIRKIKAFRDAYPQYYSLVKFYAKFRRILLDGEKLQKGSNELGEDRFEHRLDLLKKRLNDLLSWPNPNDILAMLIKKIRAQEDKILTFVSQEGVASHNDFAEYLIKKGILKRKVSGGSMSYDGLMSYAILISVGQTCLLRNISFIDFLHKTLVAFIKTGKPMLLSEYTNLKNSNAESVKFAA
jgi:hypothetical protein